MCVTILKILPNSSWIAKGVFWAGIVASEATAAAAAAAAAAARDDPVADEVKSPGIILGEALSIILSLI